MKEKNGYIYFSRKERRSVMRREMQGPREDDPIIPRKMPLSDISALAVQLTVFDAELEETAPQFTQSMSDRYKTEGEQRAAQSMRLQEIIGGLIDISIWQLPD